MKQPWRWRFDEMEREAYGAMYPARPRAIAKDCHGIARAKAKFVRRDDDVRGEQKTRLTVLANLT